MQVCTYVFDSAEKCVTQSLQGVHMLTCVSSFTLWDKGGGVQLFCQMLVFYFLNPHCGLCVWSSLCQGIHYYKLNMIDTVNKQTTITLWWSVTVLSVWS